MRRSPAGLAAVLLLFFISIGVALAEDGGSLVLTGNPLPYPSVTRPIFPSDIHEIEAAVTLPGREKARVEFVWSEPGGRVYSDTVKILYPPAGKGPVTGRDSLKVAGEQPSKSPGWWEVEAVFGDRKLSQRFLLTNNRQLLALAHGNTAQKLTALAGIDPKAEGSDEALRIASEDKEVKVRVAGMKAISGPGEGWALELLKKGQDDPAPLVRVAALKALLAAGGNVASEAAEKARADESRNVRKALVEDLAGSDAAWSTAMLGQLLKDKDFEIRAFALGALAGRKGPEPVQALSEGREAGDVQFRKEVFGILAAKVGPKGSGTLLPWLKDSDPSVRLMAVKQIAAVSGPDAPGAITPLVNDPSDAVAMAAIEALYGLGDAGGVALAFDKGGIRLRKNAVSLLLKMKGPDAAAGLARAMTDEDIDVRRAALNGLVQAGDEGASGLLVALSDTDTEIRQGAATALAALGTPDGDTGMDKALKDGEPSIRKTAVDYFIRKGGPGLAALLGGLACDASPSVRSVGMATLLGMRGEESSRSLSAYFSCGDLATRETVVDVLSSRGDPAALECLGIALKDKEPGVRLKASEALLAAGVKSPLIALSDDPDPGVRRVSLTAMSDAPSPSMLPALKKLVADPDEDVRLLSLDVLKRIPGDESGGLIAGAVTDSSLPVRSSAREIVLSRRDPGVLEGLYGIALSDGSQPGRKALDALAAMPGDKADEAILGVFRKGPSDLRLAALDALSKRGSASFKEAEIEAVGGDDPGLALAALEMAALLPAGQRDGVYLRAMSSKSPEVREGAVSRLSALGGEKAQASLLSALNDAEPAIRRSALVALAKLKDPALADRLPALVLDPDPATRAAALEEAMRLEDKSKKADALVAAVDGPYQDVSQPAFDGLLPMGEPRALEAFMRAFAAGRNRDEALRAIALVQGGQAVEYLARAYRLAKDDDRLRLFALRELAGRGPAALPALKEGMEDPSPEVRLAAFKAVLATEMAAPDRLKLLSTALADPDLEIRRLALDALGKTEGIEAARAMYAALADRELCDLALGKLMERPDPGIASELAVLAPGIKDPAFKARVVGAVFEKGLPVTDVLKFMDDPSPGVRSETLRALSRRPGPEAAYGLFVLGGEPDLADMAARGLAGRSTEELRAGLSEMFAKGRATEQTAGFAAAHLNDPGLLVFIVDNIPASDTAMMRAALDPLIEELRPYGLPAALKGLKSDDAKLREKISLAVAGLDTPEAVTALRDIYSGHPEFRAELFDLTVKNGREMDLLPLAIKDPDEPIRAKAAELALQKGYGEGLYIAASDTSARIRKIAATGLAKEPGKDVPTLLGKLVLDPDDEVASAALASLEDLGGRTPTGVWVAIADSRDGRLKARRAAIKVVAERGEATYASALAKALGDEDPDVRSTARKGLRAIGKDGLDVLHGFVGDEKVGLAVLGLLMEIGDPSSEGPIISALSKMDLAQKLLAVEVLGRFGGPDCLAPLSGLYREGPDELRKPVLKALGNLRLKGYEPDLVETLEAALSSNDEEIEMLAAGDAGTLRVTSLMARLEKGPPAGSSGKLKAAYKEAFATLSAEHGMLAYRLEIEFKEAMASKSADAFPILLALYNDYDDEVRARAVEALGEFPRDKADPLLLKAVDDRSPKVRRAAGRLILTRTGEGMLDGLTKIALSDPDLGMKAVSAIEKMQGPRADEALKEVFRKGGPDERLAALDELARRDPSPMPEVVATAMDENSPELLLSSVKILSGRKGADAVFGLLVIGGGDDAGLRELALKGLSGRARDELQAGITLLFERGRATHGSIGLAAGLDTGGEAAALATGHIKPSDTELMRAALGPSIERHASYDLPAIVKGFKADDLALKEDLAAALAGVGTPEAAQAMKEIYAAHKEIRERLLAAADGNHVVAGLLPLACKDPDESVRTLAVRLAVKAKNAECLLGAAADSLPGIRKLSAEGLAAAPGDDSVSVLVNLVLDGDAEVSGAALSSLSGMGGQVPSQSWATLAGKGHGAVRLAALRALAGRRDPRYASVLAGALDDPDQDARSTAEEGLVADGKGALPSLHPLLMDEKLQSVALTLIGDISDPSSEGPILSVIPKLDSQTKLVAVGILGKLGGPDSLDTLAGLYREGSPEVKAAVLRAVEGLRLKGDEEQLVELLRDALENGSANIRFRAARIAGRLRVAQLSDSLERGPGPGASALLEDEYRKSLMLIRGQGQGKGPTSP